MFASVTKFILRGLIYQTVDILYNLFSLNLGLKRIFARIFNQFKGMGETLVAG